MDREQKRRPPYAISSVDSALRIAAMLQLEGELTVAEVADRLGVARSTAHRLLAMLVYRDFAARTEHRTYCAGPVLALSAHSPSLASKLRAVALPHLADLVDRTGESANLMVLTGRTARFIASVESRQSLRVGNREGMVFPAHRVTGGLIMLAELSTEEVDRLYPPDRQAEVGEDLPDLQRLHRDLVGIRANGFALNEGRSERGVVAIGRPVRAPDGTAVAGLSISMPSVRYDTAQLRSWVASVGAAAHAIEQALRAAEEQPSL